MTSVQPPLLSAKTFARRESEISLKPVSDTLRRVPEPDGSSVKVTVVHGSRE